MISRDKNSSKLKTITTHIDYISCSTNPQFINKTTRYVIVKDRWKLFPYNFRYENFLFYYMWIFNRVIFRILKHNMLQYFRWYWLKHFSCQTSMPKSRITFVTVLIDNIQDTVWMFLWCLYIFILYMLIKMISIFSLEIYLKLHFISNVQIEYIFMYIDVSIVLFSSCISNIWIDI